MSAASSLLPPARASSTSARSYIARAAWGTASIACDCLIGRGQQLVGQLQVAGQVRGQPDVAVERTQRGATQAGDDDPAAVRQQVLAQQLGVLGRADLARRSRPAARRWPGTASRGCGLMPVGQDQLVEQRPRLVAATRRHQAGAQRHLPDGQVRRARGGLFDERRHRGQLATIPGADERLTRPRLLGVHAVALQPAQQRLVGQLRRPVVLAAQQRDRGVEEPDERVVHRLAHLGGQRAQASEPRDTPRRSRPPRSDRRCRTAARSTAGAGCPTASAAASAWRSAASRASSRCTRQFDMRAARCAVATSFCWPCASASSSASTLSPRSDSRSPAAAAFDRLAPEQPASDASRRCRAGRATPRSAARPGSRPRCRSRSRCPARARATASAARASISGSAVQSRLVPRPRRRPAALPGDRRARAARRTPAAAPRTAIAARCDRPRPALAAPTAARPRTPARRALAGRHRPPPAPFDRGWPGDPPPAGGGRARAGRRPTASSASAMDRWMVAPPRLADAVEHHLLDERMPEREHAGGADLRRARPPRAWRRQRPGTRRHRRPVARRQHGHRGAEAGDGGEGDQAVRRRSAAGRGARSARRGPTPAWWPASPCSASSLT